MRKKAYSGFTLKICGKYHACCGVCKPSTILRGQKTQECRDKIGKGVRKSREAKYEHYITEWIAGSITAPFVNRRIRRWIMEQCGKQCWQCGWNTKNPYSNTVMVEVDHIDGNNNNNVVSNLRLLCPNCHSLTPTWRNLKRNT